jgi:hypothetical protein
MSRPRRTLTFKQCLFWIAIWAVSLFFIFQLLPGPK